MTASLASSPLRSASLPRSFPAPLPAVRPVLEWIDRELTQAYGICGGEGGDTLLELRRALSQSHPNRLIRSFYRLLPRLERTHFLLGYRIRRWLALNFQFEVSDPLQRLRTFYLPLNGKGRDLSWLRELPLPPGLPRRDLRIRALPV